MFSDYKLKNKKYFNIFQKNLLNNELNVEVLPQLSYYQKQIQEPYHS